MQQVLTLQHLMIMFEQQVTLHYIASNLYEIQKIKALALVVNFAQLE